MGIYLNSGGNTKKINDTFRQTFAPELGKVTMTRAVYMEDEEVFLQVLKSVREFNDFTKGNDPWGEHDAGVFEVNSESYMWKIDYYDINYEYGSENKNNLNETRRLLTIMKSYEY